MGAASLPRFSAASGLSPMVVWFVCVSVCVYVCVCGSLSLVITDVLCKHLFQAINSPQILLRSGIGHPRELEEHGIPLVAALPGVGKNLQDHLQIRANFRTKPGIKTLNDRVNSTVGLAKMGIEYVFVPEGSSLVGTMHHAVRNTTHVIAHADAITGTSHPGRAR